jgi:hypothetical protein
MVNEDYEKEPVRGIVYHGSTMICPKEEIFMSKIVRTVGHGTSYRPKVDKFPIEDIFESRVVRKKYFGNH